MRVSVAVLCFLFASYSAVEFVTIDSFITSQPPLVLIVSNGGGLWYSPGNAINVPTFDAHATTDAISSERDVILGYRNTSTDSSVSVISIVSQELSVAFPLGYDGAAYIQWDGVDTNTDTVSLSPGIGSGAIIPETVEGSMIDFTSFGRATAFGITIISDHDIQYNIDVYDENSNPTIVGSTIPASPAWNTFSFINVGGTSNRYVIDFDDPLWSQTGPFNWNRVLALQVRITTSSGANAIDTEFSNFGLIGYVVTGNVFTDCTCSDSPDFFVSGETFNLFNSAEPLVVIDTTTSDLNGDFEFSGHPEGSYIICFDDPATTGCFPADGCRPFVFENENDVGVLTWGIAYNPTITVFDASILCGDCDTVECLGGAMASQCGSIPIEITDNVQSSLTFGCGQVFTRTYTDQGVTAVQVITIMDVEDPVLITPASSIFRECDDGSAISYIDWLATNGGADWTDCSGLTFSNDNFAPPTDCGGPSFVTFFATDECGGVTASTATYEIFDTSPPSFTVDPQDVTMACDAITGSDMIEFDIWLLSFGYADVIDNCSSIIITDDYIDGSIQSGCNESVEVTFTASDDCGNTNSRSATFTIIGFPSIMEEAVPNTVECNDQSDIAFLDWINSDGGAVVFDDCTGSFFTNDSSGSAPLGCNESTTISFTAVDACFQSVTTSASFTVVDSTAPILESPASPMFADCDDYGIELSIWLADAGGALANDECSGPVSFTNDFVGIGATSCDSSTVTFNGCDSCAFCVTSTSTFSIIDTEPPIFQVAPVNISTVCNSGNQESYDNWISNDGGASAIDNCAIDVVITNNAPATAPAITDQCTASQSVTFVAHDSCGNTSISTSSYSISDVDAPIITTLPADEIVECGFDANSFYQAWIGSNGGAQAIDTCSGTIFFSHDGPDFILGTGTCDDSINVTFFAADPCGNATPITATFTVSDNTAPVLTSSAQDEFTECSPTSGDSWLVQNGGMTVFDECTEVVFTNNLPQLTGGCVETVPVTFTATDECGFSITSTASITISDTDAPVFNIVAFDISIPCNSDGTDLGAWLADNGGARATDACQDVSELVWTNDFLSSVGCDSTTITFTVTDPCGNSRDTIAAINSIDSDAPTFSSFPSDQTVECDGGGNIQAKNDWVSSNGGAAASDTCTSVTFAQIVIETIGDTCNTTEVYEFTATDQCKNSDFVTASFTILDLLAPVFTVEAAPVTYDCYGNDAEIEGWLNDNGGARATDSCQDDNDLIWTNNFSSIVGCNSSPVTFTVSDSCGNSRDSTTTFTFENVASSTPSASASASVTPSKTISIAASRSISSASRTASKSTSNTPSRSASNTASRTNSPSKSVSLSASTSTSFTRSPTPTESVSLILSASPSVTPQRSLPSSSPSSPSSESPSISLAVTASGTSSNSLLVNPSPSASASLSVSKTPETEFPYLLPPVAEQSPPPSSLPSSSASSSRILLVVSSPVAATPFTTQTLQPYYVPCDTCSSGRVEVSLSAQGRENENQPETGDSVAVSIEGDRTKVDLVVDSGDSVGTVFVPLLLSAAEPLTLEISFEKDLSSTPSDDLGSSIIDITLTNAQGENITELDEPIEICFDEPNGDADDFCLSFFDTVSREWRCEDEFLLISGEQVCGQTDHLTQFALLLQGTGASNSSSIDYLFTWLSLASVALAVIFILIGLLLVEVMFRYKALRSEKAFKKLSRRITDANSGATEANSK